MGFPAGSVVKNPPASAGDVGSIPESGRSPGEGSGNPLQYSCLGNPRDRGGWQVTVHGVPESRTQLILNSFELSSYFLDFFRALTVSSSASELLKPSTVNSTPATSGGTENSQ